jgi:NTP pyrophosphatase (non-canonical NTP hydrolase)
MNTSELNIEVIAGGNALTRVCHGAAERSGWWRDAETGHDVRNWPSKFFLLWVSTKLALIHSEVSEGLEGHRKDKMDDHLPHRKMLEVELADAVIRIFDLAGGLGFDMGATIAEKLAYNAQRADHKPENRAKAGGKAY